MIWWENIQTPRLVPTMSLKYKRMGNSKVKKKDRIWAQASYRRIKRQMAILLLLAATKA